jgi:hypothetical protein
MLLEIARSRVTPLAASAIVTAYVGVATLDHQHLRDHIGSDHAAKLVMVTANSSSTGAAAFVNMTGDARSPGSRNDPATRRKLRYRLTLFPRQ